jgi:hypothetical protein
MADVLGRDAGTALKIFPRLVPPARARSPA